MGIIKQLVLIQHQPDPAGQPLAASATNLQKCNENNNTNLNSEKTIIIIIIIK